MTHNSDYQAEKHIFKNLLLPAKETFALFLQELYMGCSSVYHVVCTSPRPSIRTGDPAVHSTWSRPDSQSGPCLPLGLGNQDLPHGWSLSNKLSPLSPTSGGKTSLTLSGKSRPKQYSTSDNPTASGGEQNVPAGLFCHQAAGPHP